MMLNDKYSARIVKSPTFFRETIEVGTLKLKGYDVEELRVKLLDENPLKIMPARRNKEISSAVLVRVEALTQDQLQVLKSGSLSDKKYMTMVSIMKTERLIRELLNEVYMDKIDMGQKIIDEGDINKFFRRKAEEHEDVAKFQDVTIKKLKQVVKKILKELELVRPLGKSMEILPPIPSKQFIDAIEQEESSIKSVFIRG